MPSSNIAIVVRDISAATAISPTGLPAARSRDGRELFYLEQGPPTSLTAVYVDGDETSFSFSNRTAILVWVFSGETGGFCRSYDVSPDGQRFLAIKITEDGGEVDRPQIIVVENWFEELKRLAPPSD